MPRGPRLDASGVLHHVMARGIEQRPIVETDRDREDFLSRLDRVAGSGGLEVFAWALMDNHFHLLVRTGSWPLSRAMRSLLGGYATAFNRRHRRSGHLFQNRFKSILCEEAPYFLELVRYIHLNPLRAGKVVSLVALDRYRYSGHSALTGHCVRPWQSVAEVLSHFGRRRATAEERYRSFVADGVSRGRRPDLVGGGLVRSLGGNWEAVAELRRGRESYRSDERVLGSPDFVKKVTGELGADLPARLRVDLETLAFRIAVEAGVSIESLMSDSRSRPVARARRELSWIWIRHLGRSGRALAKALGVSPAAIHGGACRYEREGGIASPRIVALCLTEAHRGAGRKNGGRTGERKS